MRSYYIYIAIAVLIVGAGGITFWQFVSVRSGPAQVAGSQDAPASGGTAGGNPLLTIDKPTLVLIMRQCGTELFMVEKVDAHTRGRCVNSIQGNAKEVLGVLLSADQIDNPQVKARWRRIFNVTKEEIELLSGLAGGGSSTSQKR